MTMAAGPQLDLGDIDRLDSRFKRRLATRIVLVSLLSSIVAFLAADAGARENENTREAERSAVAAMAEDAETYVEYFGGVAGYAEAQPFELRRWAAEGRALVASGYTDDARRWRTADTRLANLSPLLQSGRYQEDPERYILDLHYRADLAALRQAARRETADAWGAKAERYAAVLTILAIVLSVLGLAATFGQRMWRFLVRPAVGVALGCLVFTAAVGLPRVTRTPEDALTRVADGDRLLALRDVKGAIEAYSRAIDQQPRYTAAYVRRARAYARMGSPEQEQTYVFSISDPDSRARSIADLERAFELGAGDDLLAVMFQGANMFHAGRYDDAEVLARRATDRNPRLTVAHLNLGLALAAQGRADEAAEALGDMAALAVGRPDPTERDELFAAGHTTLEQLALQVPERAGLVRLLHERLTAVQTAAERRRALRRLQPGTAISNLTVAAGRRSLAVAYDRRAIRRGDILAWIVYTRPDASAPWRQLQFELEPSLDPPGDGRVQEGIPEDACPNPGDYRVDVYAEGVFMATAQTTRPPSPDRLVADGDGPLASLGVCRPAGWKVLARRAGMLDVQSPAGPQRLTVSVSPAPPEMRRTGVDRELVELADRLAAARGFRPADQPPKLGNIGQQQGILRVYQRPRLIDRRLEVWTSLGPDAGLRTVVLEGSFDDLQLFDRLRARVVFNRLDG
jgi:tetratricopeptide (TPR) repeat protein